MLPKSFHEARASRIPKPDKPLHETWKRFASVCVSLSGQPELTLVKERRNRWGGGTPWIAEQKNPELTLSPSSTASTWQLPTQGNICYLSGKQFLVCQWLESQVGQENWNPIHAIGHINSKQFQTLKRLGEKFAVYFMPFVRCYVST